MAEANTSRSTYGVITSTWAKINQAKLPLTPISANRRSSATPSTRCGMMIGDRNNPLRKSRPGNSKRVIASAAGTATSVASEAALNARIRLL
ncbi:hypothetical protein D3C87_1876080 [compost metagenome]